MYLTHFGLNEPPFATAPGAQALYLGGGHREGLAALEWGLSEPSGLTMLAGEVGAGKTTLVQALVARGFRAVRVACVADPALKYVEMLSVIAEQLGASAAGTDRFSLLRAIKELLAALAPNGRAAVIFDEAQALSDEVLDELRLLSNLGAGALAPLKIVLVGQPELIERLRAPRFRALNQRIGARAYLNPLGRDESAAYIEHRLRAAGGDTHAVFERRALALVLDAGHGLPRRINIIGHGAMMSAYAGGHRQVRAADVEAAVAEYDDLGATRDAASADTPADQDPPEASRRHVIAPLMAASALAIAIVGGAVYFSGAASSVGRPLATSVAQSSTAPAAASPADDSGKHQVVSAEPSPGAGHESAPASPPTVTAPERSQSRGIVVRAGDTLSAIARNYLGSDDAQEVARLLRANPQINDSNLIFPGQTVTLAPAAESERAGESR